jgi:ATP-dependent DNA helicase DinG
MTIYPDPPVWWSDAESLVAASDPSFASRAPQAEAARLIGEAFTTKTHAAIDAPVGLGKSMACLVAAENAKGRTVISTATRALQEQLRSIDIPALQDAGVLTRSVVVLDGRSRWACQARAVHELDRISKPGQKVIREVLKHLRANPEEARREDIPVAIPDWVWSRICSDTDACGVLGCKDGGTACAYTRQRNAARAADIVIVNHHVLLADAAIKAGDPVSWGLRPAEEDDRPRAGVLGAFANLIIDEAHALESACESFGEHRVTIRGIQALATRVSRLEMSGAATRSLGECLDELRIGMMGLPQNCLIMPAGDTKPIFAQAAEAAKRAGEQLRHSGAASFESNVSVEIVVKACFSLARKLEAIDEAVRTGKDEFGPRAPSADDTGIISQLVDASGWLQRNLFSCVTTVAMSGTLAVPSNRDWVTHRIGLSAPVAMLPTVFDLENQRLVYVTPRVEVPAAASARSTDADVAEIKDLIDASSGRALVLFPAMTDLKYVHERLKIEHTLLAQGITMDPHADTKSGDPVRMSNAELARRFREDTSSVLLATRSFFEGVDFPGDTCSMVIVVRFPNLRPDEPLTLARRKHIEAKGGNAWRDYQEPAMQLVFRQACGRAIRRTTDRGVVAVLDPRCKTKGYAVTALRALQPSDFTHDMDRVRAFLS